MRRWIAISLVALTSACSPPRSLSELPAVEMDRFQPAVRDLVSVAVEAARASPRDAEACGRLGMTLHAYDQFGAAEAVYRRAEALDPKRFAWPYYLSDVYAAMGRNDEALAALERSLRVDPQYAPGRVRLAERLLDAGRLEESDSLYHDLLGDYPDSAAAWYGRGRVHAALGRTAEAIEALRKAVALYPQFGGAHYALALGLRGQGSAEAASHLALYEKHRLDAPPSADTVLTEVRRLNRGTVRLVKAGVDLEAQGRLDESIEMLKRALAVDPNIEQAHANLISLYARTGRTELAAEHYRRTVALNPNFAEAHYNYGVLLYGQENLVEARQAFERALQANSEHAGAHNNLGFVLEREGRTREAVSHYRRAIQIQPDHRLAHFHLGRILVNERRYREAIAHLERTIAPEDESTPGSLYVLGAAYGGSGDLNRAAATLRRAREGALGRGQSGLVATIERDLRQLEKHGARR